MRTRHNVATGAVTTRDYNYRTATTLMNATVSVRVMMRSPPGSITVTQHLYREAGDDASPGRKPNLVRLRPASPRAGTQQVGPHSPVQQRRTSLPGAGAGAAGDVITDLKEGIVLTLVTYREDFPAACVSMGNVLHRTLLFSVRQKSRVRSSRARFRHGIESQKNDIYAHLDGQGATG